MVLKNLQDRIRLATKAGAFSSLPFVVEKGLNWYVRWFEYTVEDKNSLRINSIHTVDVMTGSRTYKSVTGLLWIVEDESMWPDYANPKNAKYYKDFEVAFMLRNQLQLKTLLEKETNVQTSCLYDTMRDWK